MYNVDPLPTFSQHRRVATKSCTYSYVILWQVHHTLQVLTANIFAQNMYLALGRRRSAGRPSRWRHWRCWAVRSRACWRLRSGTGTRCLSPGSVRWMTCAASKDHIHVYGSAITLTCVQGRSDSLRYLTFLLLNTGRQKCNPELPSYRCQKLLIQPTCTRISFVKQIYRQIY